MQTRPDRFAAKWVQSEHAPDVTFFIEPLTIRMQTFCTTNNLQAIGKDDSGNILWETDAAGAAIDRTRFGLKDIKGLVEKDGSEAKVSFSWQRIAGLPTEVVSEEFLDKLPEVLIYDISTAIREASSIRPEEAADLKNTPNSPSETSTVPETSQPAVAETAQSESVSSE